MNWSEEKTLQIDTVQLIENCDLRYEIEGKIRYWGKIIVTIWQRKFGESRERNFITDASFGLKGSDFIWIECSAREWYCLC